MSAVKQNRFERENRQSRKRIFSLNKILFFTVLALVCLQLGFSVIPWWNQNWDYRQTFNLSTVSTPTPQGYQINLLLNTTNVGSHFNWSRSCNDLRFVNNDSTLLPYWIRNCNTTNADIWIKIPQNITSTKRIISMYYINPLASSINNGTATFDFFDDFSGDLSKWDKHKNAANIYINNSYVVMGGGTNVAPYGHSVLGSNVSYNSFKDGIIEGEAYLVTGSIAEVSSRGSYSANTGYKSRMDARASDGISHLKPPYADNSWNFIGGITTPSVTTNTWIPFKITINGTTLKIEADGKVNTQTDNQYTAAGEISLQNHYGSYTRFDNIRVHKLATESPSVITGLEERTPLAKITFKNPTPGNNSFINRHWIYVNVSTDLNLTTNSTLSFNGTSIIMKKLIANTSYYYNKTGILDGTYWFNVFGTTKFGTSTSEIRKIIIDTVKPIIQLFTPTQYFVSPKTTVSLNYTVIDKNRNKCWYTLNNVNTNLTNCQNTTLTLSEGNYSLRLFANDSATNQNSSLLRYFAIDNPPKISFVNPTYANNTKVRSPVTPINISVIENTNSSTYLDFNKTLVGYWNFENTNSTTVPDLSSYKDDGSNVNNVLIQNNFSKMIRGKYSVYDGTNKYIQILDSNQLDNTNKLTISFWFNAKVLDGAARAMVSKRDGAGVQQAYSVFMYTGNKLFVDIDGNGNRFNSNTVFTTGKWYYITVVYDGTKAGTQRVKLYINAKNEVNASETSTAIPNYTSNLHIGTMNAGYGTYFNGLIDEVALYKRALTQTEINSIYNSKLNVFDTYLTTPAGNYSYNACAISSYGTYNCTPSRTLSLYKVIKYKNVSISKNIRLLNATDSLFLTTITIKNKLANLTNVTVYDFLDSTTNAGSFSIAPTKIDTINGTYTGKKYNWNITLNPLQQKNITYAITGVGDYYVRKDDIIGID